MALAIATLIQGIHYNADESPIGALLDEADSTVIYVILSYPKSLKIDQYSDYLKKDIDAYDIESPSHDLFIIYDAQVWSERQGDSDK